MRYSAIRLWLLYINREPRVTRMALGLLFGVMLTPFTVMVASQLPFLLDGETVQAEVVSQHRAGQPAARSITATLPLFALGSHGPRYEIRYVYLDAAGTRHEGVERLSGSAGSSVRAGEPIPIRYVRSDPTRSQLESKCADHPTLVPLGLLGPAIVAGSMWYGGRGILWATRQVRLVRNGVAVLGTVTRAEVALRGKRRSDVFSAIEYEFMAKWVLTGRVEMQGTFQQDWQPGRRIVVLVDSWHSARHAADIFDARREDRERLCGTFDTQKQD